MNVDPGEYIVGCYLKKILGCDFVDYGVRPPGGKLEGLGELDVIGFSFEKSTVYFCEVATHILGMNYGGPKENVERLLKKHQRQQDYAEKHLKQYFNDINYMFWSPVAPVGYFTQELTKVPTLQLMINSTYKGCIEKLKEQAAIETHDSGNIFD